MTVTDFTRNCVDYFGEWKGWSVRKPLEAWLAKRGETYMDVLWPMVRDSRNANYGPPDMKCVTDLHVEVCDRLDVLRAERAKASLPPLSVMESTAITESITAEAIAKWPRIEDDRGDRWLSKPESVKALGIVFSQLAEAKKAEAPKAADYADPYHHREKPLFPSLEGVRWDAEIRLASEFHDAKWENFDNWTEEQKESFWSAYAARRKVKGKEAERRAP